MESWASVLVGGRVDAVEQWEDRSWVVTLSNGYRVRIESLWRLLSSGTLVLTNRDDGQHFGRTAPVNAACELASKLRGCTLTDVQVTAGTADLALRFDGYTLQAIAESSGYEAWQVESPTGTLAVGQGGGNVVVWD
ncbi:hypothetical protein LYSHEL_26550 [Lysobacter helvus]|uniref:Uncharacterized protein n=2 Tax=Lysobacteraceae TaxID=32033 RepID=A0ABN6FXG9_9GAMM|nr:MULTISPECIES: DUF6188 family protein [Lysobacter]BCT93630.1 hypothetical protein LYSCAS_26540 [Lysobacter caseinilyticus]BCT96784.1 hypothetical protein LYSHEL_26550 [Lysobacter helvus]